MADVLVQWGELSVGDAVVIGTSFGRVKSMEDHLVSKKRSGGYPLLQDHFSNNDFLGVRVRFNGH